MIPYRGRLEICRGHIWGTVCTSRGFSTADANTICRSLGYQSYGEYADIMAYARLLQLFRYYRKQCI